MLYSRAIDELDDEQVLLTLLVLVLVLLLVLLLLLLLLLLLPLCCQRLTTIRCAAKHAATSAAPRASCISSSRCKR